MQARAKLLNLHTTNNLDGACLEKAFRRGGKTDLLYMNLPWKEVPG